ncbi:MAG TPA: cation:proton antiporter, partial [Aestuariivirgaceae bacterium]|nr:cation:proton antiporter [Aestuariivirgaceae bacterium]
MAGPIDPGAYREALIVLGTAGVVIPAFHRLRINPILGFLIAGTIIGPNVLGSLATSYPWLSYLVLGDTEQIAQLAELGVVFLLFMVGI